ncbi:MAG: FecR domain-containing protein [Agriterribacter sp.]
MDTSTRFNYLLQQYIERKASDAEIAELESMLDGSSADSYISSLWEEALQHESVFDQSVSSSMYERINSQISQTPGRKNVIVRLLTASAAAVVLLSIGLLWLHQKNPGKAFPDNKGILSSAKTLPPPGTDKARLRLNDGTVIALDSVASKEIVVGGRPVAYNKTGIIVFSASSEKETEPSFTTLTTPKGGQYQLVLSDGTRVWMNAASSLRFPSFFTGKSREVALTGEAYFEVAKDAQKPFCVTMNGVRINVLGTHFNAMAYPDEDAIKTTLLEGRVTIEQNGRQLIMAPGQQVVAQENKPLVLIQNINTDMVMAWKNGFFQFERAGIQQILRQVERWYDVEITYNGKANDRVFGGRISRTSSIQDVLKVLDISEVKFSVEGKKITITN